MTGKRICLILTLAAAFCGAKISGATTVSLFDNLSETGTGSQALTGGGWIANEFMTGTNCPNGCTLQKVTLVLNTADISGLDDLTGFKVEIVDDNETVPGQVTIATLTNPAPPITGGGVEVAFMPSVETVLAHDSDYWVRLVGLRASTEPSEMAWEYPDTASGEGNWAFGEEDEVTGSGSGGPYLTKVEVTPVTMDTDSARMTSAITLINNMILEEDSAD